MLPDQLTYEKQYYSIHLGRGILRKRIGATHLFFITQTKHLQNNLNLNLCKITQTSAI